jgi:hypothetical protein
VVSTHVLPSALFCSAVSQTSLASSYSFAFSLYVTIHYSYYHANATARHRDVPSTYNQLHDAKFKVGELVILFPALRGPKVY